MALHETLLGGKQNYCIVVFIFQVGILFDKTEMGRDVTLKYISDNLSPPEVLFKKFLFIRWSSRQSNFFIQCLYEYGDDEQKHGICNATTHIP